jgi:hypothetical protein
MNIEADLRFIGTKLWNDLPTLRAEVARIEEIWAERPEINGFLCEFSIADAFYAPVVMRLLSYGLPISAQSQQYMQNILANYGQCMGYAGSGRTSICTKSGTISPTWRIIYQGLMFS